MSKPQLSFPLYVLFPDLLLVLSIATQPGALVRLFAFCIHFYLTVTAITFTTGDSVNDYFIGFILASQILVAVNFLWLYTPLDEIRHERDTALPRAMSFWRRLYWAFCLDHSVRAIGWSHQPKNIPPRPQEPRWSFIRFRFFRIIWNLAIADVANTYACMTSVSDTSTSRGYVVSRVWAWILTTYGVTNAQYYTAACLCVALGLNGPEDWPNLFGKPSDAYTVRSFWGKAWHQNFRRVFAPIGKVMARVLNFQPGTNTSSYTQVFTAFFLSGLIHGTGEAMVKWTYGWKTMPFWLLQASAIPLEDAVIALFRKAGVRPSWWTYLIGYGWVFAWISITYPMFWRLSIEAGWNWLEEWKISPATTIWHLVTTNSEGSLIWF